MGKNAKAKVKAPAKDPDQRRRIRQWMAAAETNLEEMAEAMGIRKPEEVRTLGKYIGGQRAGKSMMFLIECACNLIKERRQRQALIDEAVAGSEQIKPLVEHAREIVGRAPADYAALEQIARTISSAGSKQGRIGLHAATDSIVEDLEARRKAGDKEKS